MSWLLKLLVSLTVSTSLLTGPTPPQAQTPKPSLLVVAARITEGKTALHCTQPEQLRAILTYLRSLTPGKQTQEDPERYLGPLYTITLYCHRGNTRVYRIKAHRWMSKNSQPWREIPEDKAQALPELVKNCKRQN